MKAGKGLPWLDLGFLVAAMTLVVAITFGTAPLSRLSKDGASRTIFLADNSPASADLQVSTAPAPVTKDIQ